MVEKALHLFIFIMLICTHFIPSSSIPLSRTRHVMHQSKDMNQIKIAEIKKNEVIEGRMDIQINDYPPTGPNPYHTPKPPHP